MLKRFVVALAFAQFLCSTVICAQEESGWRKVSDKDGIVAYMRHEKGSKIFEGKIIGTVDAPITALEALLRDASSMKDYAYNCSESYVVDLPGMEKSKDTLYAYQRMGMPWPVQDRDSVARICFTTDPKTGTIFADGEGLKSTYKLDPRVIRMPVCIARYTLVPKGKDKTELTMYGIADPGGNLPEWVINLFSQIGSIQTFKNIRRMAQEERFRKSTGVVTTTVATR